MCHADLRLGTTCSSRPRNVYTPHVWSYAALLQSTETSLHPPVGGFFGIFAQQRSSFSRCGLQNRARYLHHFYRAALCATRSFLSLSRPSVFPSNACIVTKRTKVLPTFLYHMKGQFIYFSATKNGWWGTSPSTWNFGSNWPRLFKNGDFQSIFARSASSLTPSEKSSIMTNRNSTTSFPKTLRWTAYLSPKPPPPKGAQKRKLAIFPLKVYFSRRKSAAKFLCVKTFSIGKPFTGLSSRAQMVSGRCPLLREILGRSDAPILKRLFSKLFSLVPSPS